MFDSGVSAEDLINEVLSEADVAIPITKQSLANELNATERMLHSEVIKEQAEQKVELVPKLETTLPDHDFEL